jgi:acyl-CoA thioester hydrolase
MFFADTKVRVRYAETDQMGYVYYGNYATYCEVGRVELLRAMGTSYKKLEESGVMLPVVDYSVTYRKPAFYDDELTIRTFIKKVPRVKIVFEYEIRNEKDELLNTAATTLVFVDMTSGRPCVAPEWFLEKLKSYFK